MLFIILVSFQFLDIDHLFVNFLSSQRHLCFSQTNSGMFFFLLRHLTDRSTPYCRPDLLIVCDDGHIYWLRKQSQASFVSLNFASKNSSYFSSFSSKLLFGSGILIQGRYSTMLPTPLSSINLWSSLGAMHKNTLCRSVQNFSFTVSREVLSSMAQYVI